MHFCTIPVYHLNHPDSTCYNTTMKKFNNIIFPDRLRLQHPIGTPVPDWYLMTDFRIFWTDENGKEQTYRVKAGLVTDLSSIPWFFQGLPGMQKGGNKTPASIVHDDMYERKPVGWTRRDVDRLFYHALRALGVNWIVANQIYYAVRIGGQQVWDT